MREIIPFVIAIAVGGLYIHTILVEIPDMEGGYLEEIQVLNERYSEKNERIEAKLNAEKSELIAQVEQLQLDLKESTSTSLMFKRELDAARARIGGTGVRASSSAPLTIPVPGVSVDDSKRELLRANLQKGHAWLDRLLNERPPFREHTVTLSGRSSGVRTSDADRKKWFDTHEREVSRARDYIASVERELAKLGE